MKAIYTDHFVLPLPQGHRFPMAKYRMLRDRISQVAGIELIEAPRIDDALLSLAHDVEYINRVSKGHLSDREIREIGFPWSVEMVERSKRSAGATWLAAQVAMLEGIAVNLAGGTHHAYRDRGSGFCVFNDVAVVATYLLRHFSLKVAVIDLDVHQGNGTAAILSEVHEIFTLSLHGDKNFPFRKEASSLDIALPDGAGDTEYLMALNDGLAAVSEFEPDIILYLAGADPHENDRLGRLKLTKQGMLARDQKVFDYCDENRIPVVVTMAGGYGHQIETTVDLHFQTIQCALAHHSRYSTHDFT